MKKIQLETFSLREAERALIEAACAQSSDLTEAAKLLGISRHALRRRIVKHGLSHPSKARASA